MTLPCTVCHAAHENYRNAVARAERIEDALEGIDCSLTELQKADDHVWCCLDELNHTEAQHMLGAHNDVIAAERVA